MGAGVDTPGQRYAFIRGRRPAGVWGNLGVSRVPGEGGQAWLTQATLDFRAQRNTTGVVSSVHVGGANKMGKTGSRGVWGTHLATAVHGAGAWL